MNKIKDISYIRKQTGESLSVCKELYEKNGCDVELTLREIEIKQYSEKKKSVDQAQKFDAEKLRQEADKREKNRKVTSLVLRSVFSILLFALLVFVFYRAVNVENPLWIILYAPVLAIVVTIILKLCLPKKVWEALQANSGVISDDVPSGGDYQDFCTEELQDEPVDAQDENGETLFDVLFNKPFEQDLESEERQKDEEEWEESCEECGEYYADCECDDCGDEDCENW